MIEKILDKKFKKSMFAGYEPLDVDGFFDTTITYIREIMQMNDRLKLLNDQLTKKATDLEQKLQSIQLKNSELQSEVEQYLKEGYGQRHLNNKVNNLTKEIQNLKKVK